MFWLDDWMNKEINSCKGQNCWTTVNSSLSSPQGEEIIDHFPCYRPFMPFPSQSLSLYHGPLLCSNTGHIRLYKTLCSFYPSQVFANTFRVLIGRPIPLLPVKLGVISDVYRFLALCCYPLPPLQHLTRVWNTSVWPFGYHLPQAIHVGFVSWW